MQRSSFGLFIFTGVFVVPTLSQELKVDEQGYKINPDLPPEAYDISVPADAMDALFKKFDIDNDTVVTKEELLKFARRSRAIEARREAKDTLMNVDTNKDKRISWAELEANYDDIPDNLNEEMKADVLFQKELAKSKFDAADQDGDGLLGPRETMDFLHPSMTGKVIDAAVVGLLKEQDANKDGVLNPEEFWRNSDEYTQSMNDTYNRLDVDGDGLLNFEELKKHETRLIVVEEAQEMIFGLGDKDKDGKLTQEEFEAAKADIANHHENGILHHWSQHMEL